MPDLSSITAVPQRCGTCEHEHAGAAVAAGGVLAPAPCGHCGCAAFAHHPDDIAAFAARAAAEHEAYGRDTLLGADQASLIGQALGEFEDDFGRRYGWDLPAPAFGLICAGPPQPVDGPGEIAVAVMPVFVMPINVPIGWWKAAGGSPTTVIDAIATTSAESPEWFADLRRLAGLDPHDPVIGWWMIIERYVGRRDDPRSLNEHPEARIDMARVMYAVDIDERLYEIARLQSGGEVLRRCTPAHVAAAETIEKVRAAAEELGPDAVALAEKLGGLSPITAALVKLVRMSRVEIEARAIMTEAARNGEESGDE